MNQIPSIIKQIQATSSRNEKIAILKEHEDNSYLKTVLKATIDPYSTFFITSIPSESDVEVVDDIYSEEDKDQILSSCINTALSYTNRKQIKDIFYVLGRIFKDDEEYLSLVDAILKKDLNAGISTATVNAVWPSLINEFKVMKASEKKHVTNITYPAQCDMKMDGVAIFAIYHDGMVTFKSSSGKEFLKLPTIEDDVLSFASRIDGNMYDGFVICGELIAHDKNGKRKDRKESNGIAYKALLGTISDEDEQSLHLYAYDLLSSSTQLERGVDARPLDERISEFAFIDERSNLIRVPTQEVESYEEAIAVFDWFVAEREEGVILKNLKSVYESKRSKDWVKLKKEIEVDVRIIDWTSHSKKEGQLGSMTIALDDLSIIGKIGTKLSDKDREEMYQMAMNGELVDKIAEIVCHEITYSKTKKTHSFYLPRFERFRWDKEESDSFDKVMSM